MLKRDHSYDLFSREPEDWAGSARDHYAAKREPWTPPWIKDEKKKKKKN